MSMRHWNDKRARRIACAAISLVLLALGACAFFRVSGPADIEAYRGMAAECHPIWKQFALRRFSEGDSAAELFRRFPPNYKEEFGRYGVYSYYQNDDGIPFTSLGVVTRDGRLLNAETASCTWRFTFFQTEDAELDRQFTAYHKEKRARRERERLERLVEHLRSFYVRHSRWPTNQQELSFFITPPNKRPMVVRGSRNTNDLNITLVRLSDESVEIGLIEFPNEKRFVSRPDGRERVWPMTPNTR
jgi:hypothetical protein